MSARTISEAVAEYLGTLQQAASCVTEEVLGVSRGGRHEVGPVHRLTFRTGTPAPLQGPLRLSFLVRQHYVIDRDPRDGRLWKVHTVDYAYSIADDHGREIIAYHWHPRVVEIRFAHLHVDRGAVRLEVAGSSSANGLMPALAHAHLPTHRVSLEEIIRLLLRDFHVEPARTDWDDVLTATHTQFEEDRLWVAAQDASRDAD